MRKCFSALVLLLLPMMVGAQNVKIPKDANKFTYWQIEYGERNDTTVITVERNPDGSIVILTPKPEGKLIPGYCQTVTSADYAADSITVTAYYDDSAYYYRTGFSRSDLEWRHDGNRHTTSVNSNTLVFEMDEKAPVNVNPMPYYGLNKGVLRTFTRNGQLRLKLAKAEKVRHTLWETSRIWPTRRVSPRELDRIMKERLVVTTRIFDHVQLHWGAQNAHVSDSIPFDTVLHYAGGTLALKRLHLPVLPEHYQHFLELHQRSNGDAYDRTGSVFVIPGFNNSLEPTFFDGINGHPDSLPVFIDRNGERYQGIRSGISHLKKYLISSFVYDPPVELMRFFTPFGVGHFNERMANYGIDWADETYYRQEVSDLAPLLQGDVLIGVWIGNYDAGGHIVSLDLKSYPNDYTVPDSCGERTYIRALFNTCNVLEMAGQNYGKLFATDSLNTWGGVWIPKNAKRVLLRYISTGHGGWGEGDEFIPKQNTILIDGKPAFTHTPWRQDCGCYRDLNPVSGNFWNGLSSSDFSRSGWCPGTATQPVYFDMSPWADGKEHTLTVAIPQGKPVEGMFSHWAVSGVLIIEY
jgi:hypothetical protein